MSAVSNKTHISGFCKWPSNSCKQYTKTKESHRYVAGHDLKDCKTIYKLFNIKKKLSYQTTVNHAVWNSKYSSYQRIKIL